MTQEYKKLAASRYWFRIGRLYQAQDHLLFAQTTGYTEEYKRFYFRDIQALIVRPTDRGLGWGIFWGITLLLCAWLGYSLRSEGPFWAWAVPAFPFLAFCVNIALGPTCLFHLKTAIQTVELPIRRTRKARKIVSYLNPLIAGAQIDLPEAPGPGESIAQTSPATSVAPEGSATRLQEPQALKPFKPASHWAFFTLLTLASVMEMTRFFQQWLSLYLVEAFISFSTLGAALTALIRQAQSEAPRALRRITLGAFVIVIVQYGVGFIYGYFLGLSHARLMSNPWAWTKWLASQRPDSSTANFFLSGFSILAGLLFGLLGLVELNFYRKRKSPFMEVPQGRPDPAGPV